MVWFSEAIVGLGTGLCLDTLRRTIATSLLFKILVDIASSPNQGLWSKHRPTCVPRLGNRSAPIYNTRATIENQTMYTVEVIDM